MRNKVFDYLKIAGKIATRKRNDRHYWIGAVGIRGDGAIVEANNCQTPKPNRCAHAEYRVSKMLDYGATVYVARVTRLGDIGCARPCQNCLKVLKTRRVKKVYYTITAEEYGVINL